MPAGPLVLLEQEGWRRADCISLVARKRIKELSNALRLGEISSHKLRSVDAEGESLLAAVLLAGEMQAEDSHTQELALLRF